MKALTSKELEIFFRDIEFDYDVRLPIRLHDGTRTLGKLDEGPLSLCGGVLPIKTTSVFFPQQECILKTEKDDIQMQKPVLKPLLVAGFTAEDADCLEFIDLFFSANYRDDIYFNKRDNSVIFCISGWVGPNTEFLKITGGKCDVELIYDKEYFIIKSYTETGQFLEEKMPSGKPVSSEMITKLNDISHNIPKDDEQIIKTASKLILEGKVPQEFWEEIADRCIACTACNLACPTCTCFDIFDYVLTNNQIQRWRMWDSCQLDGFARETSGHNPMGQESLRTRRRIHHKLAADVIRWGYITCFLCGRCDEVCPTGIGIKAVSREIVQRYMI